MKFLIPIAIALIAFIIWWRFFRIARPVFPPLSIDPNDPLMLEATAKAKETIPQFRELAKQPNRGIRFKIPFLSSSGETEFLWAEVLSFKDSQMEVRYLTSPVTHTGRLERVHTSSCGSCSFAAVSNGDLSHPNLRPRKRNISNLDLWLDLGAIFLQHPIHEARA